MNNTEIETELAIIGYIENLNDLSKLTNVERIKDYRLKINDNTTFRIRVNETLGSNTFTIKTKLKDKNFVESKENHSLVDNDFVNSFSISADSFTIKNRYKYQVKNITFNLIENNIANKIVIPNLHFDIDVFYDKNNALSNFVKIDIEVQDLIKYIKDNNIEYDKLKINLSLKNLPFTVKDAKILSNLTDNECNDFKSIMNSFNLLNKEKD